MLIFAANLGEGIAQTGSPTDGAVRHQHTMGQAKLWGHRGSPPEAQKASGRAEHQEGAKLSAQNEALP